MGNTKNTWWSRQAQTLRPPPFSMSRRAWLFRTVFFFEGSRSRGTCWTLKKGGCEEFGFSHFCSEGFPIYFVHRWTSKSSKLGIQKKRQMEKYMLTFATHAPWFWHVTFNKTNEKLPPTWEGGMEGEIETERGERGRAERGRGLTNNESACA